MKVEVDPASGCFRISVREASGKILLSSTPVEGSVIGNLDVFSGSLDRDGNPDFAIRTFSCGCGLAAEITFWTLLFSSGRGFEKIPITTFDGEPSDFVDVDGDGIAELIHTAFIYGGRGRDGREHNYWVFNLLGFEQGHVISRNRRAPGFPCWVMYTFKPNRRPTKQLSPAQKHRLWREQEDRWFPGAQGFAQEQGNRE